MGYFLTADGGTGSIRARVYDLSGTEIASEAVPYDTHFSSGARAEQAPADWWRCFVAAARKAIAASGVDPSQIESIALATTCCSVVALDENGDALRPAIIWMDVRAGEEADAVLATGDEAVKVNGAGKGPVSAEWMIPKALWIKRHEPEIFDRAHTICEYQDFMTMKLTGERVGSLSNVSLRWHHSPERGGRPDTLIEKLGLEALKEKWPSEIVAAGDVIGPLSRKAADELGLGTSVKVVQGGVDALVGIVGLGVCKPGQLALITGSSHLQYGITDKPIFAPGMWGAYDNTLYPGRYLVEGGQTSTGSIIEWLGRMMNGTMDLAALNKKAAELEPGSDGLIVQDHFQGNRTPYTDSLSRGAIIGLTLAHEPHHVFRAIMEGISLGTRLILDTMAEAGFPTKEITIGGGTLASPLWLQIHADTAGLPVVVPNGRDAPSVGAAVLAAKGAGHFDTIDDGIAAMVKPGRRIEPRKRESALYEEIYARYRALYPALKALPNIQ